MDLQLSGKRAIVLGATRGIGRENGVLKREQGGIAAESGGGERRGPATQVRFSIKVQCPPAFSFCGALKISGFSGPSTTR
jgi:hypothetical protein